MRLTGKELMDLVRNGSRPTVEFTKECEEFDYESFDPGMRARLISVWVDDECLGCKFDISEYEEFNKAVEQPVWYGKNGEMIRWSESAHYPKDKSVKIYIGDDYYPGFEVIEENTVLKDYRESGSKMSYVQWLEEQYLKSK